MARATPRSKKDEMVRQVTVRVCVCVCVNCVNVWLCKHQEKGFSLPQYAGSENNQNMFANHRASCGVPLPLDSLRFRISMDRASEGLLCSSAQ